MRRHMTLFLTYCAASGGHMYPKHHYAYHLALNCDVHGNPKYYHTYADESENRIRAQVAKAAYGGEGFYGEVRSRVLPETL